MAELNVWQRINRVLPGLPFGNGISGNATLSSSSSRTTLSAVSSGQTAITIGAAILSNGDIFALHQSQGVGAGQWEINKVVSGGGTTSIVCDKPLQYDYVAPAQVIKIVLYNNVTLNSYSVTPWDGSVGGIDFICGKTSITGTGILDFNGGPGGITGAGNDLTAAGGSGGGYRGGPGRNAVESGGIQGEGSSSYGIGSPSANGEGGGGGAGVPDDGSAGAGGGHGGVGSPNSSANATPGGIGGTVDLIGMIFGGGGGGGYKIRANPTAGGGSGAGILVLISRNIDISGMTSVTLTGGNGGVVGETGGGGGAGGSCLAFCISGIFGDGILVAGGGIGGNSGQYDGGNGGVGVIAVHHSGIVTGSTTPAFTDVLDPTIVESVGGFLPFM
jgi:hypothetical protein